MSWGKSCHLLKKGFSNFIDGHDDSMKDDDIVDDGIYSGHVCYVLHMHYSILTKTLW